MTMTSAAEVIEVDDDASGSRDGGADAIAIGGDAEKDGVGVLVADVAHGFAGADGVADAAWAGGPAGFVDVAIDEAVQGDGGADGEDHAAFFVEGEGDEDLAFGGAMDGDIFDNFPAEFIGGVFRLFSVIVEVFK